MAGLSDDELKNPGGAVDIYESLNISYIRYIFIYC